LAVSNEQLKKACYQALPQDSPVNQENEQLRAALRTATKSSYRDDNIMSTSASDSTPGPSGPWTGKKRAFSPDVVEIDSDGDVPMEVSGDALRKQVLQSPTPPRKPGTAHNGQTHKRHRSNTYHSVNSDGEEVPTLVFALSSYCRQLSTDMYLRSFPCVGCSTASVK
jgi:hypothetical protein